MSIEIILGLILLTGFIFAEVFKKIGFPKVTGYILAGIFLNPGLTGIIPADFSKNSEFVIHIALSFITFSVGGTLLKSRIKSMGKAILTITFFEAQFALLFVALGFLLFLQFYHLPELDSFPVILAFSILVSIFASPTDPSATLAVQTEYKAKGKITSMIMGVAAFDDVLGIINFSVLTAVALSVVGDGDVNIAESVMKPVISIGGAILLGIASGLVLKLITKILTGETDGLLIVVISGFLIAIFGIADWLHVDELLSTMTFGAFVVNYSSLQEKIFRLLERYTDELIFLLFFTLSGMHLNFGTLGPSLILILCFVILRAMGKFAGTYLGGSLTHESSKVKKLTAFGLIPQGGIVIGMALLLKGKPAFSGMADIIISIIIGATIVHEIIGPVLAKYALKKAGEIKL
jgi:Kef-type K+ transport system membrane component KefB